MSDTANDLNIDLITSSYLSKESSGSALNDNIAANINNIHAIASELGGNYELANKVQNAVYANISDYGSKSLALQDRGALEATKDFAVNTLGKGLIGGTLSGIGGALGLASAATGSDMLAEGAAAFSGLGDYARKGSDALLSKAQTDYDTVSHRKADSAYNYNKLKRDTKIANGGDPTIAGLGNFLDDVMTAGSHLDMNDLTGATAEGLGNLLGMAATGGVGAVVKGGVMGAAKLGAAKLGATAALEAAQSSKAARILGKVFDAPTRANMMFEAGGGVDNAVEAINSYSDEQLAELSPEFNSLVEQYLQNGASPEEASQQARLDLRNQLIRTNALETGLTGAAIGRLVPGTERGLKSLGGKGLGAGSIAGYMGKAASEGVEEFGQEGSSTLIGNINEKALLNKDKDTLEGVGQSAVMGAVGGIGTSAVANARPGSMLKGIYDKGKEAIGKFSGKGDKAGEAKAETSAENERASTTDRTTSSNLQSNLESSEANDAIGSNAVISTEVDKNGNSDDREYDKALHEKAALDRASADEAKKAYEELEAKSNADPSSVTDDELADAHEKAQTLEQAAQISEQEQNHITLSDDMKQALNSNILQNEDADTRAKNIDNMTAVSAAVQVAKELNSLDENSFGNDKAAYENRLNNLGGILTALENQCKSDIDVHSEDVNGKSEVKLNKKNYVKHTINNLFNHGDTILDAKARVQGHKFDNNGIDTTDISNILNWKNRNESLDINDETKDEARKLKDVLLNIEGLLSSDANLNTDLSINEEGKPVIDNNKTPRLDRAEKILNEFQKGINNKSLKDTKGLSKKIAYMREILHANREIRKAITHFTDINSSKIAESVYREKLTNLKSTISYSVKSGKDKNGKDYKTEYRSALPSALTHSRRMMTSLLSSENTELYSIYDSQFREYALGQWEKLGDLLDLIDKYYKAEKNHKKQNPNAEFTGVEGKSGANDSFKITPETIDQVKQLANILAQECALTNLIYNSTQLVAKGKSNKLKQTLNVDDSLLYAPDLSHLSGNLSSMSDVTFLSNMAKKYKHISQNRVFNNRTTKMFKRVNAVTKRLNRDMAKADTTIDSNVQAAQENIAKNKAIYTEKLKEIKDNITDDDSLGKYKEAVISYVTTTGEAIPKSLILKSDNNTNPKLKPEIESLSKELSNNVYNSLVQDVTPEVVDELNEDEFDLGLTEAPEDNTGSDTFFGIDSNEAKDFFEKEFNLGETEDFDLSDIEDLSEGEVESYSLPSVVESLSRTFGEEKPSVRSNGKMPSPPDRSVVAEPDRRNNIAKTAEATINGLFTRDIRSMSSREKEMILDRARKLGIPLPRVIAKKETQNSSNLHVLSNLKVKATSALHSLWRNFNSPKALRDGSAFFIKRTSKLDLEHVLGQVVDKAYNDGRITKFDSQNYDACSDAIISRAITLKDNISKSCKDKLADFINQRQGVNPRIIVAELCRHKALKPLAALCDLDASGNLKLDEDKIEMLAVASAVSLAICATKVNEDPFSTNDLWEHVPSSVKEEQRVKYQNTVNPNDFDAVTGMMFKTLMGISRNANSKDEDTVAVDGIASIALDAIVSADNAPISYEGFPSVYTLIDSSHPDYNPTSPDTPRIKFTKEGLTSFTELVNNGANGFSKATTVQIESIAHSLSPHYENDLIFTGNHQDLDNDLDKALDKVFEEKWKKAEDILHTQGQKLSKEQKAECKSRFKEGWNQNTPMTNLLNGLGAENLNRIFFDYSSEEDLKLLTPNLRGKLNVKRQQTVRAINEIELRRQNRISILTREIDKWNDRNIRYNHAFPLNTAQCMEIATELLSKNRNEFIAECKKYGINPKVIEQHYMFGVTKSLRLQELDVAASPVMDKLVRDAETNITTPSKIDRNDKSYFYWKQALIQGLGLDLWKVNKDSSNWKQDSNPVNQLANEAIRLAEACEEDGITLVQALEALKNGNVSTDDATKYTKVIKKYLASLKASDVKVEVKDDNNVIQKVSLNDIKADQPIILHVLSELPEAISGNNFESSLYIEIDGKSCGPSTRIGRFGYTMSLTDFQLCDRGGWHTSFIGTHEDLQKLPAEIDKYIKSAKTEAEKEALTKYKENIVSGMKTDVYAQQAKKANEYIKDMQSHLTDGGKNNVGSKQLWEAITNVYDIIGINLSDIPRLLLKLIATPLAYGAGPLGAAVGFTHIIQDKIEETLSDFNKHLHNKYAKNSANDFSLNSKQLLTEFGHFKGIDDDQAAYEVGYKFFNSMDIFTNYRAAFSGKTWESYTVTCTKEENSASSSWFRNVMLNLNSDKSVITKSTLSSGTTNLWSAITMANLTSNHYVFINSPISMGATSVYPNSSQRSIFALTNLTACLNLLNGFYTGYAEMASRVANGGSLSKVQERDLFNSPAFVNMSKALGIPCGIDGTSTYFTGSSKRSSNLKGVKGTDELLKTTINGIPYTIKPSMYQWTPLGVACQPGITQGSGDADIIMRLTRQIGDKTFGAMFDGINCFLKDINDLANIIDEAQVKTNHQNLTAQLHVAFNKMGEFINKHTDLLMYNQNDISSNIMRAMASSLINMSEVYLEEINKSNKDDAESILSIITESDANTLKSLYADLGKLKSDIANGDAGSLLNKAYENTQQVLEIVTKAHFAKTFALTGIPDANGQRELANNPLFTEYDVEPDTGLPMSYLNFDTMSFSSEAGKTKAGTNNLRFDSNGNFIYTNKHFYYDPVNQELYFVEPSNAPKSAEEIKTVHEYNARVTDVAKHKLFLNTAREIYEQGTLLPKVKTVSLTSLSLTKAKNDSKTTGYTDASSDELFTDTQDSSNINSVLRELSQGIENGMRYRFDDKDKEAYRELKNKLLDRLFNLGLFNYSAKPTKDIQLHEIFAGVDFIDVNEVDDEALKSYGLSDDDINDIRTNKAIDGFSFDNKIFLPAHTVKDLKDTMEALKKGVSGYTIEKALTLIDTITHEYQHVFLGKSLKEVYFSKADDVKNLKEYAQKLYKAKREAADKIEYIGKTLSRTYANMCIAYYNYLRHNISIKPDASQSQQELDAYAAKVDLLNRYVDFIATTATGIDKNKNLSKVFTEEEIKDLRSIFSSVAQAIKSKKSTTENAINTKKYDPQTDGFVYDLEKILRKTLYKDINASEELFSIKYELERGVIGLAQISKAALEASILDTSTGKPSPVNSYTLAQETIVWGNNSTFLTNLAGNTSLLARLSRTGFASEYNKDNAEYKTNTDVSERVSKEAKYITSKLAIRGRSAMWTFLNSFINTGTKAAKALRDVIYNFINNVMGLRIKKVTDKNGKKTKRKQIAFPNGTKKVELSARDILGNAFAFFNKKTLVHTQQTGGDVNLHIENASSSGNINASQKKIFETIKNYGDKLVNSDKKVDVTLRKAFVDSSVTVDRACKACKNAGFLQTNKELNAFKATFTALTFNMGFNTEEGNNLTRLLQKVIKDITPEDFDPTYNPALNQGAYNVSAEAVKKYQFIIQGFNNSNYQYVNPKVAIAMLLTDEALQEKFKNTTLTRESVAKTKNFDSSIEKAIFTALGSVTDSVDRMMSKYPDKISGDVVLSAWYEAASNAALDLNSEEYQAGLFTSVLNKADELTSKAVAKLVRKGAGALSKSKIPVLSAVGTYVKEASTYVGNPALGELDTLQGAVKATTVDLNDFIRTTPENALGYLFNNKVTGWLMAPIAGLFREFANQSRGDTNYYIQKKKSRNTTQQLPQHAREQTTKIVKNSVTSIKSSAEWQSATDLFIKSGLYNNTDTASSNYISKEDIEKYLLNDNALNSDIRNANASAQSRQLVQALVRYTYEGKIATNMQKKFRPNTYSISKATGDDLKAIQKLYTLESIRYIKDNNPESGKRLYSILKKDSSGKDFNYLTSITRFRFNKDLEKIKKYSSKVNGSQVDPMLNYFEGSIRDLPRSMNHIVAIKDSNDLAKYNQLGYTKINTTSPNGIIYMESPYSMENSFLSGAFSYSLNTGMGINLESCRPINAVAVDGGDILNITSGTEEEPVIPLYNADGTIALGGSVLPNKTIMDRVQKDTNLANLLGEWSGRYLTEEQAANCNKNMLVELKNLKDNASPLDSNNFINILNPKEAASLPPHTKKALSMVTSNKQLLLDAKEVFGDENTLYVRKDMLNDVLGMQRASIVDVLNGNTELPKFFTDLTKVIATIAGGPANLAKLEKTLQNLAKYVRNSQVIKSFVVPYANIVANAVQLLILGVPPQDIIKGMRLKIKECNDYVKILNEVALLRATGLSREGTVSDNEAQAQKLLALTEQMSISPMIKAGEFNSITDDVITRDELDINNPSLGLFNKYSEKVSNMLKDHPNVRALLVDKDSDTYRFLAKATQYGDFIAKSIYYDHLKKTKVNENEALYRATTAFVNYDFMPSRGRDYFESLGLAWYFNYKLRMSKIMLHMMQFNPVRSMIYAYLPLKLWDVTLDTPFKDSSLGRFLGMGPSNMSSIGFDNFFKLKNYIPALNLLDVLHY